MVTGASQGIGRALALEFAAHGAKVAVAARNRNKIEAVAAQCGPSSLPITLDVGDEASCLAAVAECATRLGPIDILINNAGVAQSRKFTDTDTDLWRHIMSVDVEGPFWLTKAVVPTMLAQGFGRVIAIGSVASRQGLPYVAAYTAAKHALLGLTRSISAEYAKSGITFNCVCPFYVDTPMTVETIRNIVARTNRTEEEAMAPLLTPQGRLISTDELAALCLFLASTDGRSITGQAINVDGGRLQS